MMNVDRLSHHTISFLLSSPLPARLDEDFQVRRCKEIIFGYVTLNG